MSITFGPDRPRLPTTLGAGWLTSRWVVVGFGLASIPGAQARQCCRTLPRTEMGRGNMK
jgi:hypothetical protein